MTDNDIATVGELIAALDEYDPTTPVRLATQPGYPLENLLARVACTPGRRRARRPPHAPTRPWCGSARATRSGTCPHSPPTPRGGRDDHHRTDQPRLPARDGATRSGTASRHPTAPARRGLGAGRGGSTHHRHRRAPVWLTGDAPAPDPALTDTTDLLAAVWLPAPPPAALHTGDVVVRLHAPADDDPAVVNLEVVAATQGGWSTVRTWQAVGTRWPHEVALSVLVHMRYLADATFKDAQWATLTGPIAAALPPGLLSAGLAGESAAGRASRTEMPSPR